MRRKIFLQEVTSNVLAMIHASLDAVSEPENTEKGSWTMAKAKVGTNVILWLYFEDVFIARVDH